MSESRVYLAEIVGLLQQKWPGNRTINIVCHGHSVPAGYFATPVVDTFHSYPHLMHRGLNARFPSAVINVIVTAIGGESSPKGAERFDRDVLPLRPDVLLIDYSLNDRGIGLAKAKQAWESMIEKALAREVKTVLLTPTADLAANLEDPADPLNEHAEQVRGLARDYNVALIDSLGLFREYIRAGGCLSDLMSQRNHPNAAGHRLVAAELVKLF
jgi:acyl-CoA thioesterase I